MKLFGRREKSAGIVPFVRNNVFSSNAATDGGAIEFNWSLPTVNGNIFTGNTATHYGGALHGRRR
ncbi:MAG: hypothetical protein HY699_25185 [Deltaproteobacteria bacterium]|nr:hypothetical protein [Deltaproteobacteria bacterium]